MVGDAWRVWAGPVSTAEGGAVSGGTTVCGTTPSPAGPAPSGESGNAGAPERGAEAWGELMARLDSGAAGAWGRADGSTLPAGATDKEPSGDINSSVEPEGSTAVNLTGCPSCLALAATRLSNRDRSSRRVGAASDSAPFSSTYLPCPPAPIVTVTMSSPSSPAAAGRSSRSP